MVTMRTRRRDGSKLVSLPGNYKSVWTNLSTGKIESQTIIPNYGGVYHGPVSIIADVAHPDFKKKFYRNVDISSPCIASSVTITAEAPVSYMTLASGLYNGKPYSSRTEFTGSPFTKVGRTTFQEPPPYYDSDCTAAKAATFVAALASANRASFQGSLFAAEALKTLRMVRRPLESSRLLLRKMMKRKSTLIQRGLSASKAASAAWLEYRYGWRTLFMDVSDLFGALNEKVRVPNGILRVKSSKAIEWAKKIPFEDRFEATRLYFGGILDTQVTTSVRAGVRYRITDSSYSGYLENSLGISARSFPGLVWELIPFSFIADWFINIGDLIETIVPNYNIEIVSSFVSVRKDMFQSCRYNYYRVVETGNFPGHPDSYSYGSSERSKRTITYNREVNLPFASVPSIVLRDALNLKRQADSISLLIQTLSGQARSFNRNIRL